MSNSQPDNNTQTDVTAEAVAQFLRANPDFFVGHEELLADIRVPHANTGSGAGAVSLVERQVGVLRERNVELRERLNGLLSIARDNDIIFEKTRALVLALLESRSIDELAAALSRSLLGDFGMATQALLLFEARADASNAGIRVVDAADVEAQAGGLLRGQRIVCGVLRPEELRYVFADGADAVGSAAIIPLLFKGQLGLLAIGARDPQHFKSGMDTLFVGHIGDVLARCLHAMTPARDERERARHGN